MAIPGAKQPSASPLLAELEDVFAGTEARPMAAFRVGYAGACRTMSLHLFMWFALKMGQRWSCPCVKLIKHDLLIWQAIKCLPAPSASRHKRKLPKVRWGLSDGARISTFMTARAVAACKGTVRICMRRRPMRPCCGPMTVSDTLNQRIAKCCAFVIILHMSAVHRQGARAVPHGRAPLAGARFQGHSARHQAGAGQVPGEGLGAWTEGTPSLSCQLPPSPLMRSLLAG